MNQVPEVVEDEVETQSEHEVISLSAFITDFGSGLLKAVQQQTPPVYDGKPNLTRKALMNSLLRKPFEPQQEVVQAVTRLLVDHNQPAAIINAEMGTGKTMMAIAAAAVMHQEGFTRSLIISPPHLVYKWRREIKVTVPDARVWILNGQDTLRKLLQLRLMRDKPTVPEFFIMGRVRMRMGFNWKPVFNIKKMLVGEGDCKQVNRFATCPACGGLLQDEEGNLVLAIMAEARLFKTRSACTHNITRNRVMSDGQVVKTTKVCGERLWTLVSKQGSPLSNRELVAKSLCQIPTIGEKTANALLDKFGENLLSGMLSDNVYEFINLMDDDGELVFNDRQATRMERAMAKTEFAFGQGGYQATEFIKRYLPQGYFGLLVVDEGHEYKNENSAQGQAMGVLAAKCKKTLLLTGTLMGGYADDLFYLLHRLNPGMMIEDGFAYNNRNSLGTAAMGFMREHGILKDIFKETSGESHRTARGKSVTHRTSKGPGFGPMGIMRYVLPITAFLKLKDIGGDVLPPYQEHFREVPMTEDMGALYRVLSNSLKAELKDALRKRDTSLLGVVLNVLLAWPDTCFRDELVRHPRTKAQLAYIQAVFDESTPSPKELELLKLCRAEKTNGRRVLVYSTYTGTRDTTARLKNFLEREGFKTAVLRASVDAAKREDWLLDQVDRGVEIIITNPELVKTGLDMLEFPTIVFMQSGYNVYTLQQASRRSWRIGQKNAVDVYFLGYAGSAQMQCLELMAKKIAVSQSTSGDMPDSGLDILNQSGDSIEVALARQLLN
jgi:hypothetical protein